MWGIIFVTVILILILSITAWLILDSVSHGNEIKKHKKHVYKVLHHYAEEHDHYLLNDVELYFDENNPEPIVFDHILFANKYIYVITDLAAKGGIYGNINDELLFFKKNDGSVINIHNPLDIGNEKVKILETAVGASHDKHLFLSMIVYNPSLIVHKDIRVKNGDSCFIPITEVEETIDEAEKDSVTSFDDNKTKELVKAIKERSDQVKRDLKEKKARAKKKKHKKSEDTI